MPVAPKATISRQEKCFQRTMKQKTFPILQKQVVFFGNEYMPTTPYNLQATST